MTCREITAEAMDDIFHALGRPADPLGETYRNYYCGTPIGHDLPGVWRLSHHINDGRDPIYVVTDEGRQIAADFLEVTRMSK